MADDLLPKRYPEMNGKVALVTGGSAGIGLAAAQAFAREGATVIIASRNEKRGRQALSTLADGGRGNWSQCDVTDGRDVEKLISSILRAYGQIDYAFNNAGSGGKMSPVVSMTEAAWSKTINGYLTSVFLCMRYQLPSMLKAEPPPLKWSDSNYGYFPMRRPDLPCARPASFDTAQDAVRP